MTQFTTINDYIESYPKEVQTRLQQIRNAIKQTAPDADEAIKYGIPTFVWDNKNLVHFGAFTHHIGFYPTPGGIEEFKEELSRYKSNKGSVQFPLDSPMPLDLIKKITAFRLKKIKEKKVIKSK